MAEVLTQSEEGETDSTESYIDPESLDPKTLENFLKEGEVQNIRMIESGPQPVPKHADQVLIGDMFDHEDLVYEADLTLPEQGKKLLVVYKPDSGINQGTEKRKVPKLPRNSSPYSHKEVAAWLLAQNLGFTRIVSPVVLRTLEAGPGSLRPYIWGDPLGLLPPTTIDKAFQNQESLEDIAFYDYLLQTMDRRLENIILVQNETQIKAIDHSLTFFDEEFASRYTKKGLRLRVAYDNRTDPPRLKETPLPERLREKLEHLISTEIETKAQLSELLTEEEIDGLFQRARNMLEQKIFL